MASKTFPIIFAHGVEYDPANETVTITEHDPFCGDTEVSVPLARFRELVAFIEKQVENEG